MSAMQSFMQGASFGRGVRRNKQAGEVNSLAAMGNLSGASQKATEYGMHDHAQAFQQQLTQLDAQKAKAAAEAAQFFGQVAGASLDLPMQQRRDFAASQLQMRGYDPAMVDQMPNWDDATLQATRVSALDAAAQIAQANNVRDFELKAEDTRADNARELMNTKSQVADRTADNTRADSELDWTMTDGRADNARADMLAQNTIRNTDSQIADRTADNARADAEAANPRSKPFNEAQAKAANFADRAAAAHSELEALVRDGFNPSGFRLRSEGVGASQKSRQYERAKREFVNSILRQESGAAIGKDEFANAEQQYFPQLGDSPDTIKAKAEARRRAIDGLKRQSQGAYEGLFGGQEQQGSNSIAEGTVIENDAGERLVLRGGEWVRP